MNAAAPQRPSPTRVWLVDDDRTLLNLLERRIAQCGWQSRGFETGPALEEALQTESPHVLVLDRLLPEQSGTHLLARLRRQGHRFPVLILSALGSAEARIEGLEIGADDYMAKPFLWRELELRLQRLLELGFSPRTATAEPMLYRFQQLVFNPTALELHGVNGAQLSLSRGEACLLASFCRSPKLVIERPELLRASGSLVDPSSRSLDVRISRLRNLLDHCDPGSGQLLEAVRGRGYRLNTSVETLPAPQP